MIAVEAHHVGGIVGKAIALAHLEIRHCINAGNISIYDTNDRGNGWAEVAGILGGIMTINGTWGWSYVDTGDFYIYDCHNFGNLKGGYTGGIFGATYQIYHDIRINIEGCTNHGTVTTAYRTYTNDAGNEVNEGSYAGGIVASLDIADKSYGSLYIKNCLNTGSVTGSTVGGILGVRLETGGTRPGITQIINCSNTGKIHSIYPSHEAAGIVGGGHGTAFTVRNCSNSGEITNASATGVAHPIGPDYSHKDTGDGYTVLTKENNYYTEEGVNGDETPFGELNATKAAELLATNTELAYSKGTVTDGGLYSTDSHTYYILSEAHLTSATRENVELKLYHNITVENTDPELSRALTNSKLDGNGKTVTFQNGGLFLFDCIHDSEIRNLNLTGNISSTTNGYLAPLASEGSSYGLVLEDITSSVNITVTPNGMLQVGGVIGRIVTADSGGSGTATLKNVTYSGTIKSFADVATGAAGGVVGNIGGISPTLQGDVTVTDCSSSGNITSKGLSSNDHSAAGGLFGSIEKNVTISDCEYTGAISIEDERVCAGGIAGHIYALTPNDVISVSDCDNYGTVASGSAAGIVGGVCADFPEEAISNAETDLSCLNQYNTMKITIENCQNAGGATIKGKRNSSGILGDVTMIYSQRLNDNAANNGYLQPDLTVRNCVNSAAVESYTRTMGGNIYVSGIVACLNRGLVIDCINEGDIYGVMRTAGIIGAKHKPTAEMLTVKNCKNTGDVTGRLYSGGIMSMSWKGNMEILNCVNSGTVTSFGFDNKDSEVFAGGILGYMGGNTYSTGEEWLDVNYNDNRATIIDHCVNAGAVVLSGATGIDAPRLTDGWRCAGGIVSTTKADITITNCVNLGRITTDPNNPDYSAYPIVNGDELPISTSIPLYQLPERLITASGNYYLEGSVLNPTVDGETKDFQFSEMGDAATLEALIREADVYVFDKTMIDANDTETIAGIAKDIIANGYDGMYTDEQRADLSAKYTNATDAYGNLDPYLKQNLVYDYEDNLRDAVFAYTDEAKYVVYLPVGNLEGDREYTVEFRPTDFTRFASAEVTIDSENDYKLTDSHGNVLNYVLQDKNGTVYTDGSLLFEREAMKNASNTAISKVIKAVVTPNDAMPAGTYRDTISYTITYHSGKPNEGTK